MKVTCVETIIRYKTIDVPDVDDDLDITEIDDDLEIRELMWEATDKDGWDHEYCLESTMSEGEHEPVIYHG